MKRLLAAATLAALAACTTTNAMERYGTREEAVELLIQLRNGERRSVVQAVATEILIPGDSVILVNTGGRVRVSKAPVVAAAPNT